MLLDQDQDLVADLSIAICSIYTITQLMFVGVDLQLEI